MSTTRSTRRQIKSADKAGHVALRVVEASRPPSRQDAPQVRLHRLDQLWFQVTGTLCNLACSHCFISCSPTNRSLEFLDSASVYRALDQSTALGVREYYYTGGEPFLHPEILPILQRTLEIGPATVLTNGTLLRAGVVNDLARLRDGSIYSLELRVSIDGPDAASNDAIRGRHAFNRAMAGVERLVGAGFLPIITMAQTWDDADGAHVYDAMRKALLAIGYKRPRIKLLPSLKLGAEVLRSRGYHDTEFVTQTMMAEIDESALICATSRILSSRGVHVCPILIDAPDSLLAPDLESSTRASYTLAHSACFTCWMSGAICSNASTTAGTRTLA